MSNTCTQVDWVMETHLQRMFDGLIELIRDELVTYEEVLAHLRIGYATEIADWFQEWWDEYE